MSFIRGVKGALRLAKPLIETERAIERLGAKELAVPIAKVSLPCLCEQSITKNQYNLYVKQKSRTLLDIALEETKGCKRFFEESNQLGKSNTVSLKELCTIPISTNLYQLPKNTLTFNEPIEYGEDSSENEVNKNKTEAKENKPNERKPKRGGRPQRKKEATDLKELLSQI